MNRASFLKMISAIAAIPAAIAGAITQARDYDQAVRDVASIIPESPDNYRSIIFRGEVADYLRNPNGWNEIAAISEPDKNGDRHILEFSLYSDHLPDVGDPVIAFSDGLIAFEKYPPGPMAEYYIDNTILQMSGSFGGADGWTS